MTLQSCEGFAYRFDPTACEACKGACCRGAEGYIWVKREEIEAIATYLGITTEAMGQRYLRRVGHRISLREYRTQAQDAACIFFDETNAHCRIYPVRPKQCRSYPFWEQYRQEYSEVKEACPGVVLSSSLPS